MELQRIKLLEDRSQYPRVRVRFTDSVPWEERICLYINVFGYAVCVANNHEKEFLKNEGFTVSTYSDWEEIKEPTYRPYKTSDNVSEVLGLQVSRKQGSQGAIYAIVGIGLLDDETASVIYKDSMMPRLYFELKKVDRKEDSLIAVLPKDLTEMYEYLDGTPIGVKE
jgi:hypothetical protein